MARRGGLAILGLGYDISVNMHPKLANSSTCFYWNIFYLLYNIPVGLVDFVTVALE